jgi:hypothetical protein
MSATLAPGFAQAPYQALVPGVLGTIGRALQRRLETAFPLSLFEHSFVPAKLDAKQWGKLTTRTPFVGLGWNEVSPTKSTSRLFDGASTWSVFLTTKSNFSVGARYFGDSQGEQNAPGLFAMVQMAVAVLHGMTIREVGTVMVTRASNAYGEGWDENMATCVIDLAVATAIALPDAITAPGAPIGPLPAPLPTGPESVLGNFTTLGATWNLAQPVGDGGGVDEIDDVIVVPVAPTGASE